MTVVDKTRIFLPFSLNGLRFFLSFFDVVHFVGEMIFISGETDAGLKAVQIAQMAFWLFNGDTNERQPIGLRPS